MELGLPAAIVIAAIAWIVLYVIIGIPLWIAFVVAGGVIALGVVGGGAASASKSYAAATIVRARTDSRDLVHGPGTATA